MAGIQLGELAGRFGWAVEAAAAGKIIHGAGSLDHASSDDVAFYADPRYGRSLKKTRAAAVLVPTDFSDEIQSTIIRCENPAGEFAKVLEFFRPPAIAWEKGVHPTAVVSPGARVSPEASVQPYAVIEDGAEVGAGSVIGAYTYIGHRARVGEGSFLHPHVVVEERCVVGSRVILHGGVVVGSDGFGYEFKNGRQEKIPQTGIVEIGDDVEIGANTTIDRARFGRTLVAEGAKIDNQVQIGHNVTVGPHSVLCAQVGISGSTRLGSYVTLAGKVGVNGHIEIGDQAMVGAMSGVVRSIPAKEICAGRPPLPMKEYKRNYVQLRNIHKLYDRVKELEAVLEKEGMLQKQRATDAGEEG